MSNGVKIEYNNSKLYNLADKKDYKETLYNDLNEIILDCVRVIDAIERGKSDHEILYNTDLLSDTIKGLEYLRDTNNIDR